MSETHQSSVMCLIVKNKKAMIWFTQRLTLISRFLSRQVRFISEEKNESPYFNDFPFILQKDSGCIALNFIKVLSKIDQWFTFIFQVHEKVGEQLGQDKMEMRSRLEILSVFQAAHKLFTVVI